MAPWIIPAALGGLDFLGGLLGAGKQQSANMDLARYQNDFNYRMWQENNAYNTPSAQMQRFRDAGLNPALMYGQGNPGSSSAPVRSADIRPADYQSAMRIAPIANQTAMTISQVQALEARTRKDTVVAQLNDAQRKLVEANPLLNGSGYMAVIDSLKATAEIKASEAKTSKIGVEMAEASKGWVVQKIAHEVTLLEQRFRLGELDEKIKTQVLLSKEFENAILEIQKKFVADGDIGPQQIYQFINMLLTLGAGRIKPR